jgi:Transglycosylase SLT domain
MATRMTRMLPALAAAAALLGFGQAGAHPPAHAPPPAAVPAPQKVDPAKPAPPSTFALEQRMSYGQRVKRWDPLVAEASKRFNVPQNWIRAVLETESGGRTMLGEKQPIVSSQGAMGLMQLMPETYGEMRRQYGLGRDPFDPHDNIIAATAYLRWLRGKYGYPQMFAAYNDGPGNLEERMMRGGLLPAETSNYVGTITGALESGRAGGHGALVKFTRPDGSPVLIDSGAVVSVRAAFPGEYAPGVLSVITAGRIHQGVREAPARAKAVIRARGGAV